MQDIRYDHKPEVSFRSRHNNNSSSSSNNNNNKSSLDDENDTTASPSSVAVVTSDVILPTSSYILTLAQQYERPELLRQGSSSRRNLRIIKYLDPKVRSQVQTQPSLPEGVFVKPSTQKQRGKVQKELQTVFVVEQQPEDQDATTASSSSSSQSLQPSHPHHHRPPRTRPVVASHKASTFNSSSSSNSLSKFGLKKSFIRPSRTPVTQQAATHIQRIARGWWQREYAYKLHYLQYQLDHADDITQRELQAIQDDLEQRKLDFYDNLVAQYEKKQSAHDTTKLAESKKIQDFLQHEHDRLQEQHDDLTAAIDQLKDQNERLEQAHASTLASLQALKERFGTIQETHEQLRAVEPKYQHAVRELQEALWERQDYCETEHKIRLHYDKFMDDLVERLKQYQGDQHGMVAESMDQVLQLIQTNPVPDVPEFVQRRLSSTKVV